MLQACQGLTFEAMHTVKEALTISAQRPAAEAWALLALLLSAQSQHALAIDCVGQWAAGRTVREAAAAPEDQSAHPDLLGCWSCPSCDVCRGPWRPLLFNLCGCSD